MQLNIQVYSNIVGHACRRAYIFHYYLSQIIIQYQKLSVIFANEFPRKVY